MTRPNGITTNYNYDSLSHLLSVLHQAGTNILDGASCTYDPAGNRTSKGNYLNGVTSNYTYDPLYELTQVTQGTSTTESYSYDAVGNRLSSSGVPNYSYNSSNELTSNSNGSYTYDANGNTLSDPSGKTYTWDFENRMVQAVVSGSGTTTFKYDPFGRRIQKSGPNGLTNYLYDGGNILETTDQNGNFQARYAGTLNADEPLAELISGATSYYEQDGINSITSLSSSSGALTNTYSYDSYGTVTGSTGTIANPFQYTGRELDSETSLYYYRARQYDARAGRFLSEDPEGFDASTNFYAYVDNDPVNWTDPTGLDKVQACCRPLRKAKPLLMIWHHCYIKISDSSGAHTWGILPDSQGNQIPVKDDPRNSGGKCKDVPGGTQCGDAEKLRKGLDDDASSGSCPSCGANYHNWWWRFAGYNSNTFVYNMLSGAGFAPPREPRSPGYNPAPGGWYP